MKTGTAVRTQASSRAQVKPIKNILRKCKMCFQPSPISAVRCVKCGERFQKPPTPSKNKDIIGRALTLMLIGLIIAGFWILLFK